jgi:uncharacterized protein
MKKLNLYLLPEKLGVYRLDPGAPLPGPDNGTFFSVTRTADEISVVCREDLIPADCPGEKGFRILKVKGPLDFNLTGILASLLNPLAAAGISVFAVSTYDTDYILVKDENLKPALSALGAVATIIQ